MCNRGLGVKALLIYLHLLGESLSGISDGSKKVGEERELGARVGEGLFLKSTDVRVRTRA